MPPIRLSAFVLVVLLSACGGAKDTGPERKTAAGEVLGGSISDAMLPLDKVQSQSPPLRESAEDTGADESTDGAAESTGAAPAASATPPAAASASATPQAEN